MSKCKYSQGGAAWVGSGAVKSGTILVVDTNPVFRTSLTDILNRAGYKAHGASDGRGALGIADTLGVEIDLIVLELAVPDMSGVALLEALAIRQRKSIKVIASSSPFSQAHPVGQTSLHAHAGIVKQAPGTPAIAAKWLLTVRSLLGELADSAEVPRQYLILVADDDASVRLFVKTILTQEGYQILEAADGESALALAQKVSGGVDLVVADIEMPGMDGRALGKAIRETYPTVPVIYISGFTQDPELNRLHDPEHELAFIGKPFQPKVLLETVARMLNLAKLTG